MGINIYDNEIGTKCASLIV
ncbi:hypothetical protein F383_36488 [Gossypium arboreum]|uniref:Uncharacterized protein n=1 Tax=Gossypium arboreum TaxID=29729 RepID=A0A0B0PZX8_GOSAR|nr:hypothetical protein F383_36488 [Gossypium arboreum]